VTVKYKPGKDIPVADTLSRSGACEENPSEALDLESYVESIVKEMPVSDGKMEEIQDSTKRDEELQQLQRCVKHEWPESLKETPALAQCYWNCCDEITEIDGIMFKGAKIIIPKPMRQEMLMRILTGHMGIQKSKEHARDVLYWPGMAKEIEDYVSRCSTCQENQNLPQRELLLPRCIPSHPWQMVGTDLFWWNGANYLLIVDNYSNFFKICLLSTIKSAMVVQHTKSIFARHGIPEVVISDNNAQYSCQDYKDSASKWGFQHKTSPVYPQANRLAERMVQTVKNLLQKAKLSGEDPYLSLLSYRNTPVSDAGSPAQLLMNRRLRTDLPTTSKQLVAKILNRRHIQNCLIKRKIEQKHYYDRSAKARKPLHKGDLVRFYRGKTWQPATVIDRYQAPRSYHVETPDGCVYRRNQRHLIEIPIPVKKATECRQQNTVVEQSPTKESKEENSLVQAPTTPVLKTRSGRIFTKPK
jgi:hypothetical protein